MRHGWKLTGALGFVGAVAVAAAAFGQVGTGSGALLAQDDDGTTRDERRARIAECRERFENAETDEERQAIREECGAKRRHHRRHALGKRMVHGEVKVQTDDGFALIITDAGTVTAVDGNTLTLERADGETVTVTASDDTKIRKGREAASMGDIEVGDIARVVQVDDGESTTVKMIHARTPDADAESDATTQTSFFAA